MAVKRKPNNFWDYYDKTTGSVDDEIIVTHLLQSSNIKHREWYIYPRSTHWRHHLFYSPQHYFIDAEFRSTFRMTRCSFEILLQQLSPFITKQVTRFRVPHSPEIRLAVFLYHITMGIPYKAVATQFGIGNSTVGDIVGEVAHAICEYLSR